MAKIRNNQSEGTSTSHNFPIIAGSYNGECADYHAVVEPRNQYGVHARPAALIVGTASRYDCQAYVQKADKAPVSAKSIMGLMTLEASIGTPLVIWTKNDDGIDAEECLEEIVGLFNCQFNED